MAKRLNPYVIRNAEGAYYTRSSVVGSREAIEPGTKRVIDVPVCAPVFGTTDETAATQFHTKQDALDHIANPDLGGPKAFEGCEVLNVFEA